MSSARNAILIETKYPAKCAKCHEAIQKGARIAYYRSAPRGQKVMCLACHQKPEPAPRPGPAPMPAPRPESVPEATPLPQSGQTRKGKVYRPYSDGWARVEYESMSELIELALDRESGQNESNRAYVNGRLDQIESKSGNDYDGITYYNGYTVSMMLKCIENPPTDLMMRVDELRRQIESGIEVESGRRRRVIRRLDAGDEVDPFAYAMGEVDCWSEARMVNAVKPVVRIAVNVVVSAMYGPETVVWRGAAAAALADILTIQGYSVELYAFEAVENFSDEPDEFRSVSKVIVKHSDMPIDLPSMAFALSEIAFFRIVMMSAGGRCLTGRIRLGWGRPVDLPPKETAEADIVIDQHIRSKEAAEALVRKYAHGIKSRRREEAAA